MLAELGERELALSALRRIASRPVNRVVGYLARADAAQTLAELGEFPLALDTLNDMIQFAGSDRERAWAAGQLAVIGDRKAVRRELTNIVMDVRATPDNRLNVAQSLSTRWGPSSAMAPLNAVIQKRTAGTHNREAAIAALRAVATDNREDVLTRLAAKVVLVRWTLRHD